MASTSSAYHPHGVITGLVPVIPLQEGSASLSGVSVRDFGFADVAEDKPGNDKKEGEPLSVT